MRGNLSKRFKGWPWSIRFCKNNFALTYLPCKPLNSCSACLPGNPVLFTWITKGSVVELVRNNIMGVRKCLLSVIDIQFTHIILLYASFLLRHNNHFASILSRIVARSSWIEPCNRRMLSPVENNDSYRRKFSIKMNWFRWIEVVRWTEKK